MGWGHRAGAFVTALGLGGAGLWSAHSDLRETKTPVFLSKQVNVPEPDHGHERDPFYFHIGESGRMMATTSGDMATGAITEVAGDRSFTLHYWTPGKEVEGFIRVIPNLTSAE